MKHTSLDDLKVVSTVRADPQTGELSRNERLERWAKLLERAPDRRLATLRGTEYEPPDVRHGMRASGSAISVAFEDPVLRRQGLKSDTYGDAKEFFNLDDWQLHGIVCYCHFGASMSAETAARCVRATISQPTGPGIFERLARMLIRSTR
ncbi:hypothetical protein GR183_20070 [Stappia sp. GBMRC 2046]|uniref:Uncharacterized protein n=1 Tax=Stappia sediminis TaxID=2692190 RepID=A0A7X3LY18_9HYPH|nr:hypothetical protein [Stappia sediminis]MXN67211.1 hypothetical protein [Stappia sediminis]